MASDPENKVSVELTVEDREALKSLENFAKRMQAVGKQAQDDANKTGKEVGGAFENAFKIKSLVDVKAAIDLVFGGLGKVRDALEGVVDVMIDLEHQAEGIRAINQQFDILAAKAGLSAAALRDGLVKAADGLVDTEDLLEASSKSVVALGKNAERIPEVFELARKASAVFGGDLLERFEGISRAIESGNTKSLKQIGLIVQTDEVYKEFAKTIGVTADRLTTMERQQALLEAVLKRGDTAFAGVNVNIREFEEATRRANVQMGELKDTISEVFDKTFGQTIREETAKAGENLKFFNELLRSTFLGEGPSISEEIDKTTASIERFTKSVTAAEDAGDTKQIQILDGLIARQKEYLDVLQKRQALAAGATGDLPLNLDPTAARNALRAQGPVAPTAAVQGTGDPEKAKRDAEILEQERNFQAELTLIRAQGEIARQESEVQIRDLDSQNRLENLAALQAFEQTKLQLQYEAQLAKAQQMEEGIKKEQEIQKLGAQRMADFEKLQAKQAVDRRRLQLEQEKQVQALNLQATGNFIQAGLNLAKDGSEAQKALLYAQAIVNTYSAANQALAAPPGPPWNLPLVASVVALGLSNVARISQQKYAMGGIVPGSSFSGDQVPARVNSGEMILTREQQATLFEMANGRGGAGGDGVAAMLAELMERIESRPIVVQVSGREIARVVRDERAGGFAV